MRLFAPLLLLACAAAAQTPGPDQLFRDAVAAQQRGDDATAVRDYRELLKQHPEVFQARANLGVVLARQGHFDEAIEDANDCEYGLTSSIYTRSLDIAMRASNELKFGETYVNRENFEAMQGFHAGWRKSGIGGADGKHGLEEYLQTHVVYMNYDMKKQ